MPRSFVRRKRLRTRRGRRFIARKKRFARRVKSVILRTTEPKKLVISSGDGVSLIEGDGTTRIVQVQNIPSNMAQGVEKDMFIGDQVYIKGIGLTGQASIDIGNGGFQGFYIRWLLLWSRSNASGMTGSGAQYNSTTTAAVQPAQTTPLANPVFFEATGNLQFTGDGFQTHVDTTNCKVIGVYTVYVNPGGNGKGIQKLKHMFKVNSRYQFLDPTETSLATPPNYGKYGSYYLVRQVIASANSNSVAVQGVMDLRVTVYYKDV